MTKFDFTIEQSQLQEKIFISSLRDFLAKNNFKTFNTEHKAGTKRTVNFIGGFNIQKHDIYNEVENPFIYERKFPMANILGIYTGEILVENTRTFQKQNNNENVTYYQYILKGDMSFRPKKVIAVIILILGFIFAIANSFSMGTILFFIIFLIIWAVIVRILGKLNTEKVKNSILDKITHFKNLNN